MYNKVCEVCLLGYIATGPAGRYCPTCAKKIKKERHIINSYNHKLKYNKIKMPGTGKGGNPSPRRGPLANNSELTANGVKWRQLQDTIRNNRIYCEHCGIDTRLLSSRKWNIHHRDKDTFNNNINNLSLLCWWCHRKLHNELESSETISKESRAEEE